MVEKIRYVECYECGTPKAIKYILKENDDHISVNIFKCTNCKHQYGLKALEEVGVIDTIYKQFPKDEWDSFHDTIFDLTGKESIDKKALVTFWESLPENLKKDSIRWGLNDSVVRDNIYEYLQKVLGD